jgi:hypothetical protein
MALRFALDHRRTLPGILLAVVLGVGPLGCRRAPRSIAPEDLARVAPDSVARWVAAFTPKAPVRYDLRWQFRNDRGAAGGRAAVRVVPPDSLRFDFRGPFGKSGAAVVVGATGVWARPEGDFKDVLQSAPLFWAALGAPLRPPVGAETFGAQSPGRRSWRYAVEADTFDFVDLRNRPVRRLLAEMRRRGRIVGAVDAQFDPAGARVVSARMDFPSAESRFSFSVEAIDSSEKFGPEIWARP